MRISRELSFLHSLFDSEEDQGLGHVRQHQPRHCSVMILAFCSVISASGIAQPLAMPDAELQGMVRAASSSDRDVWWAAARRLGTLASRDMTMRAKIWRRAHVNTLGMRFVRVEAGEFTMGPDRHRLFDSQKAHKVRITKPFFIAVTEVTNEQFTTVFPGYRLDAIFSPDSDSPAVRISWKEAAQFCKLLSEREGSIYRLPTEAEWEYVCRGGRSTRYSFGMFARKMPKYGWCMDDHKKSAAVATLQPNDWGLYDMHGNVFEWVSDYFSDEYYAVCAAKGTVDDPKGPENSGWSHVLRSCGWQVDNALACTCTARFPLPTFDKKPFTPGPGMRDTIGFRVVREVSDSDDP